EGECGGRHRVRSSCRLEGGFVKISNKRAQYAVSRNDHYRADPCHGGGRARRFSRGKLAFRQVPFGRIATATRKSKTPAAQSKASPPSNAAQSSEAEAVMKLVGERSKYEAFLRELEANPGNKPANV